MIFDNLVNEIKNDEQRRLAEAKTIEETRKKIINLIIEGIERFPEMAQQMNAPTMTAKKQRSMIDKLFSPNPKHVWQFHLSYEDGLMDYCISTQGVCYIYDISISGWKKVSNERLAESIFYSLQYVKNWNFSLELSYIERTYEEVVYNFFKDMLSAVKR